MAYFKHSQHQFLAADAGDEAEGMDTELADSGLGEPPAAASSSRLRASAALLGLASAAALVTLVALQGRPQAARTSASVPLVESTIGLAAKAPWECSADGGDCQTTQCCSKPGSQCYVKNEYWASCNATCKKGVNSHDKNHDTWACDTLGERTPLPCSWEGANCAESKCCRRQGLQCFEQVEGIAYCEHSCEALENISKVPWSCNVLGGDQGVAWAKPSKENPAGTTLFCFTVVTEDSVVAPGVEPGYEMGLIKMMEAQNASVFGCDASKVYEGSKASHGDWQSVVNTDIFINVWNQVKQDGLYQKHDWTVKVDADAVFFPARLKTHLASLQAPAGVPLYLKNIDFRFQFMGALEVLSKQAVDLFIENVYECKSHIASNGGEDFFTMQCLDAVGVAHMADFSLLDDKYTHGEGWNMFDVDFCVHPEIVAYHPYKAVNSWLGCYKVAMGIQVPTDFVGCSYRFDGDACSLTSTVAHGPMDPQPSDGIMKNRAA